MLDLPLGLRWLRGTWCVRCFVYWACCKASAFLSCLVGLYCTLASCRASLQHSIILYLRKLRATLCGTNKRKRDVLRSCQVLLNSVQTLTLIRQWNPTIIIIILAINRQLSIIVGNRVGDPRHFSLQRAHSWWQTMHTRFIQSSGWWGTRRTSIASFQTPPIAAKGILTQNKHGQSASVNGAMLR